MAKAKRGHSLWRVPSRARGTCPICSSTRIKLLYPVKRSDGKSITVCKRCAKATQERIDGVTV